MKRISDWINQLINGGGVCRTAPATLGLLKSLKHIGAASHLTKVGDASIAASVCSTWFLANKVSPVLASHCGHDTGWGL